MTRVVGWLTHAAKQSLDRVERRRVPEHLRRQWVAVTDQATDTPTARTTFAARLDRDRTRIIPWLERTRPLRGQRILEVGCGPGASTVAMSEQGAMVTAIDVSSDVIARCRRRVEGSGLAADFVAANAAQITNLFAPGSFDQVIFWAALEHMTLDERLAALAGAAEVVAPGGLITTIETPNRLWYFDSHTARLPFFMWLPDELAYRVAVSSPREGFGEVYGHDDLRHLHEFQRRGRGVSHHEFDLALGPIARQVTGCMQLDRRARSPLRRLGWHVSEAGRFARLLQRQAPDVPAAYFQPFLYLTVERSPT